MMVWLHVISALIDLFAALDIDRSDQVVIGQSTRGRSA